MTSTRSSSNELKLSRHIYLFPLPFYIWILNFRIKKWNLSFNYVIYWTYKNMHCSNMPLSWGCVKVYSEVSNHTRTGGSKCHARVKVGGCNLAAICSQHTKGSKCTSSVGLMWKKKPPSSPVCGGTIGQEGRYHMTRLPSGHSERPLLWSLLILVKNQDDVRNGHLTAGRNGFSCL